MSDTHSSEEIEGMRAAVKQDPKRNWGTPYVEKLLNNLSAGERQNADLSDQILTYRQRWLEQREIADVAVQTLERIQKAHALTVAKLKKEITGLRADLAMLPQRLFKDKRVTCRNCRHSKPGWVFWSCRRFPTRRTTFAFSTCGEGIA